MSDFEIWFVTGLQHILDLQGYDHILFVSILAVSFPANEWKKLLGLITAFTLGHSLTLALSATSILKFNQDLTEILIALTILTSAIVLFIRQNHPYWGKLIYGIICFFGLIHGMGFSYLLKTMLPAGEPVFKPLLLFNLGLELGQIIIVVFVLLLSYFLIRQVKLSFGLIQRSVAVISGIFALALLSQRFITLL